MPTVSKFYLHKAAPTPSPLPPSSASSKSSAVMSTSQSYQQLSGGVLWSMNGTIGTSQTDVPAAGGVALASAATTSSQQMLCGRWVSDYIAAQTISAQNWTFRIAASETNANHNFKYAACIAVHDVTGTVRSTRIYDSAAALGTEPGTSETDSTVLTVAGSSVTCSDQDMLVFEVWNCYTQSMATSYTADVYWDGTTEGSTTTNAAYLAPTNAITMYTPVIIPDIVMQPYRAY